MYVKQNLQLMPDPMTTGQRQKVTKAPFASLKKQAKPLFRLIYFEKKILF